MSEDFDTGFNDYVNRVNADREEAVLFLANSITKKDRDLIRFKMNGESHFGVMEPMLLGMAVRNLLRGAGFFYDLFTLENVWYDWLKEAVSLPDEKVVLTDSIRVRKSRCKEFMEKEGNHQAKMSTKHEWVSEKVFVTSMALLASIFFIISLTLHCFG